MQYRRPSSNGGTSSPPPATHAAQTHTLTHLHLEGVRQGPASSTAGRDTGSAGTPADTDPMHGTDPADFKLSFPPVPFAPLPLMLVYVLTIVLT